MEFHALLPHSQRPEHTEGYEGFFHLTEMTGDVESAKLSYIVRDHDGSKLERRKAEMERAAAFINTRYGDNTAALTVKDSYRNMAEVIQERENWRLIEIAYKAVEACGGTPRTAPIRGGTDGSRLSFMGLPCPNLGTGGHNAHGRMEYVSVQSMDKVVDVMVEVARLFAV
jgi:tripeptide aminopeptidase